MRRNPIRKLTALGQSLWLDFISRRLISSGELEKLIDEDSLRGMTSNPTIFENAIDGSPDYDDDIEAMAKRGMSIDQIYSALTIRDIQDAADAFRPVYDGLEGSDGFVSLEVSPRLARDAQGTIAEVGELWKRVDRPNVLIKIPATREGLPAIQRCVGEGINVNVTLLFGLPRYREVAEAYIAGLEERARRGERLNQVASVASFFLSRIDALVDPMLDEISKGTGSKAKLARGLRGQVAIASAKLAYQIYKETFGSERFRRLASKGARPQRVLWASTSTKDPSYSDVKYVEALIGRETVNTVPMESLDAYRDHGQPELRLESDLDGARQVLTALRELDIDIDHVTSRLVEGGVEKFVEPFDRLMDSLRQKRLAALGRTLEPASHELDVVTSGVERQYEIGVIGLGVMGRGLIMNATAHGHLAVGYDRNADKVRALAEESVGPMVAKGAASPKELVGLLRPPRAVMLLVPAGKAVDEGIRELLPALDEGDIVIDAGNSHFEDTDRRAESLSREGISFLGVGVSGGEAGARFGASIMPGGSREAYERVEQIFTDLAAKVDGEACVSYLGAGSAGHYVKMIHNGIEYGLMQLIAETYDLMKRGLELSNKELGEVFRRWNGGELSGFLVEITAEIFDRDDQKTGHSLIDRILDSADQKGTGMWTSQDAMKLKSPTPTIDTAVAMRNLSAMKDVRMGLNRTLSGPTRGFSGDRNSFIYTLGSGLYCAMVLTYEQGLSLLARASEHRGYGVRLADVVRIWRGGCIIRAALLNEIVAAYQSDSARTSLLQDMRLSGALRKRQEDLRAVVMTAINHGIAVPGLAASLAYYDAIRSAWLPANLVQAQRDYFGAHTYQRIDEPGTFHTQWTDK